MSISNASTTTSQILRWKHTATGGETTLSGGDDSGTVLAYTPGYEQLYVNGVMLVRNTDYVATTGSTITGLTALTAGDTVEILALTAFSVANTYTTSQVDAAIAAIPKTNPFFLMGA